jgi:hypothetical protein
MAKAGPSLTPLEGRVANRSAIPAGKADVPPLSEGQLAEEKHPVTRTDAIPRRKGDDTRSGATAPLPKTRSPVTTFQVRATQNVRVAADTVAALVKRGHEATVRRRIWGKEDLATNFYRSSGSSRKAAVCARSTA